MIVSLVILTLACLVFVFLACFWYREHAALLHAVIAHWVLLKDESRRGADFRLWRNAQLPIRCLECGHMNANFIECTTCGAKQKFDE